MELPARVKGQLLEWIDEVLAGEGKMSEFGFVYVGGEVLAMREQDVQGLQGALSGEQGLVAPDGSAAGVGESGVDVRELESLRAEVARLRFAQREARARERARLWREQGLITPAQEPLVVALLCAESDSVRFSVDGREMGLEAWLERFLGLAPRFPVGSRWVWMCRLRVVMRRGLV